MKNSTPPSEPVGTPGRVSLSEVVRAQMAILARPAADHSAVTIARGARGQVTWEVAVHVGTPGADDPRAALALARELHDALTGAYPFTDGTGGAA